MKTKITIKDAVVLDGINDASEKYWDIFCESCRHANPNCLEMEKRCDDCRPRVAPPTRYRKEQS